MAKLVGVYRSDEQTVERRQLPLAVDDQLKMVVQFDDTCMGCNQIGIKQRELEKFVQKYRALTNDEIAVALMATNREIFSLLAQLVPCVGCRRSVERLFNQLVDSGHPSLEPLVITKTSGMSIERNVLFEPKALYALFYIHGSKLSTVMDSIPKSKKNKRCVLHSLDTHKTKSLGMWMDVWDILSSECREEVVLVECDCLMSTLENYLRKHRFCSECKAKVLRAYNILTGEVDSATEKGYCRALYEGLSCCHEKHHIHVSSDTDYIAKLIGRAEPELTGSRRERHAKTLDIAQEEVLTCLGIHLYERLHRIWQKLRAEEQTWQILFYLGVDALRKNFEMELERKQGISQLELTCLQLLEEEQAKEMRREQKRQKRKKKKNKTKAEIDDSAEAEAEYEKDKENCKCDENTNDTSAICASCDEHNLVKKGSKASNTGATPNVCRDTTCHPCRCDSHQKLGGKGDLIPGSRSDCGYSSGHEGCDTCSMPSSNDGSEIACSEGICNHDGDSPLCHRSELPEVCTICCIPTIQDVTSPHSTHSRQCADSGCPCVSPVPDLNGSSKYGATLSLQDMLEANCSSGDDDAISEEEIQRFKANQKLFNSQRLELRETLRQRFNKMCMCRNPTECKRMNHSHYHGRVHTDRSKTAQSVPNHTAPREVQTGKIPNHVSGVTLN